ncbi:MAG: DUF2793 domain-containing protein [Caulobacterales bacterium]
MSDQSANLSLRYLAPAQAQKHVTVNESLLRLDAIVQLSVVSATTTAQPGSPTDGCVYILPSGKTGAAWGAMANGALAYWRDGAWEAITPREGWLAWVQDTNQLRVYDGAAWTQSAARAGLGLGAAALKNTGTSGDAVALLNTYNTWSALQDVALSAEGYAWRGLFPSSGYLTLGRFGGIDYFNSNATKVVISADASGASAELVSNGGVDRLKVDGVAHILTFNANAVFHAGAHATPAADNSQNLGSA